MASVSMVPSIRRLDETVVNRIAAGEVVQRPANALKEMLENSLDAKATNITVTVKDGGLKILQIQDNGIGIRREDLSLVCERFTTSKLTAFEDLMQIGTYGFRGEALASITHVAHLTITTRTADSKCAFRARYTDGRLREDPRPCAGNVGTQILVEDLFFNMAARRQALRSPAEEFNKISEVVSRYAIHNSSVGFTLKKQGEPAVYLRTPPRSSALDNIRTVFGAATAKELLQLTHEESSLKLSVSGYISGVNFAAKKSTMLLFINHRLVESTALRKALEQVYSSYLPRHAQPFIYLSLQMAPEMVDVNVHPTKNQVYFLHEDQIIELIQKKVDSLLVGTSAARTFYTQTLLPGASSAPPAADLPPAKAAARPQQTVRTSHRDQKLDTFVRQAAAAGAGDGENGAAAAAGAAPQSVRPVELSSVLSLREEVERGCHSGLRRLLAEHSLVGVVTAQLSLVQHQTRLYLVNHRRLAEQLFYQICLYQFGALGLLQLEESPPVRELALLGLEQKDAGWTEEDGPKEELADCVCQVLQRHADMLDDYFSIQVDGQGRLRALPLLLDHYEPPIAALPGFLTRLATEVDWETERQCLHDICREIARFYSWTPATDGAVGEPARLQLERALLPAVKEQLLPTGRWADDGTVLQVADLPDLYKVFERC
ncbi:DNA mismatch repair protein Mlh1-like isoform X2 [Amphibalanus amphitrite]|uniref:DNA mismatch repair protein Mlh1-like isoform X2 n=1 Tax=Amphibalanus amphitrite TaxID=1232801 RepID=UPI001C92734A|nr:DNA mismatch repair protein Mlh1-like isoform X2 [Amphibalanus amphitrite]XP_043213716.1 DNA mismatch repair protein Mlh1-like isoform X2 [Amphibalanus amphitrite]XP_043213717.1 DNA mismatch repair protein Mlh1-like isoform X2 [Amphibalanus amphitrite]